MFRNTRRALTAIGLFAVVCVAAASAKKPVVTINPTTPKPPAHSAYDFVNLDYAIGNSVIAGNVRGKYHIDKKPYGNVDVFASTRTLGVHQYLFIVLRNNTMKKYNVEVDVSSLTQHLLNLRSANPDGSKPAGYSMVILDAQLVDPHHPVQVSALDFGDYDNGQSLKSVDITVHVSPVADPHDVTNATTKVSW